MKKIILKEDNYLPEDEIHFVGQKTDMHLLEEIRKSFIGEKIYGIDALHNRKTAVDVFHIMSIESEGKLCNLKLVTGEMFLYSKRLKYILEDIPAHQFFQINNQTIINKHHIITFETASNARMQVTMKDNSQYFVSRFYLQQFKEKTVW